MSLTRSGLVEQDPVTGHYGIGRLSLTLGLKALGRVDVVRLASDAMPALRDRIDETVVLTVWGDNGPTIVRFEESRHPVTLNVFERPEIVMVRSRIPSNVASGMCSPS